MWSRDLFWFSPFLERLHCVFAGGLDTGDIILYWIDISDLHSDQKPEEKWKVEHKPNLTNQKFLLESHHFIWATVHFSGVISDLLLWWYAKVCIILCYKTTGKLYKNISDLLARG